MEAITREEKFLAAAAGNGNSIPVPVTRQEKFLEAIYDRVSMGGITQDQLQEAVDDYFGRNPLEGEFVKTVNGIAPDKNGNVVVSGGNANQGGGLSTTAVNLLMEVFSLVKFHSNPTGKLEALKEALLSGSSGDSGGETPEEPDEPVVVDDITVADGIMTIVTVGSEITVSGGVMTIA